jgi:hypothetical protein
MKPLYLLADHSCQEWITSQMKSFVMTEVSLYSIATTLIQETATAHRGAARQANTAGAS